MYTDLNEFHWNSRLTIEEKQSIIKFVRGMSDEETKMLRQIIKDEIDEDREANDWGMW